MPTTLVCVNCDEESISCCGAVSGTRIFSGIKVSDGISDTWIHRPFYVTYDGDVAGIADERGHFVSVDLADTTYGSLAEMKAFISGCKCQATKAPNQEYFLGHSSAVITVVGTLPADRRKIAVFVNGNREYDNSLSGGSEGYDISGSDITLNWTPPGANILVEWTD